MTNKSFVDRRRLVRSDYNYTLDKTTGVLLSYSGNENSSQTLSLVSGGVGSDRPNWRSVIKARGSATNPYSGKHMRVKPGRGRVSVYTESFLTPSQPVQNFSTVTGWLGLFLSPNVGTFSSVALNRAKASFVSNARQAMSPFQGGVFLGELREAIELIRRPGQALFRGVVETYPKVVKKRLRVNKKSLKRLNKVVSETWLEYSFGWAPLLHDIRDGAEALARLLNYSPPLERVTGGGGDASIYDQGIGHRSSNDAAWLWNYLVTDNFSARIQGGIDIAPQSFLNASEQLFSLNWTDVLPTVWELIPYSFLVDYFTNLGDIISSATFVSSKVRWLSLTERSRRVEIQNGFGHDWPVSPAYKGKSVSSSAGVLEVTSIQRSIPSSLVPSFQFNCPGVGSMKWLNIAALAGVRGGGRSFISGSS